MAKRRFGRSAPCAVAEPPQRLPIAEDFPELIAAREKLEELDGRRAALAQEERDLAELLGRSDEEEAKAIAVLEGGENATELARMHAQLQEVREEQRILERACAIQRDRIAEAFRAASVAACESVADAHMEAIGRVVRAAAELVAAVKAEREFCAQMQSRFQSHATIGRARGLYPASGEWGPPIHPRLASQFFRNVARRFPELEGAFEAPE